MEMRFTSSIRRYARGCLLVLAGIVVACSSDSTGEGKAGKPSAMSLQSGGAQTAAAGAALPAPVVLQVADAAGRPVPNVAVAVTAQNGTASPAAATTNASGSVSVQWTLGTTAGPQTLTAAVSGLQPVTITATAVAGPVARVILERDSMLFATLQRTTQSPVRLEDTFGNAATGTITWASTQTAVATVDASGRITAAGNGVTIIRASVGAAVDSLLARVAQVPAALHMTPGAISIDVGANRTLIVTVVDSGGAALPPGGTTSLRYSTTQPAIAQVDAVTGVITGASAGVATVTARDTAHAAVTGTTRVAVTGANSVVATTVVTGSDGVLPVTRGQSFTVPVVLDLARVAGAGNVGAADLRITFNNAVVQIDSVRLLTGAVGNTIDAGVYAIAYAALNANGPNNVLLATLFMRVPASAVIGAESELAVTFGFDPVDTTLTPYTAPLILPGRVRIQ